MLNRTKAGSSRFVAAITPVVFGVRAGFAATSLPVFSGQLSGEAPAPVEPLSLWYRAPATAWTSALPVGNGRQAAMMFGGIDSETICLNKDTLWAGGPYNPDNPNAPQALAEVRRLLFDGKYRDAETLITRSSMGRPATQAAYQPVGDIQLSFAKVDTAENYRRDLNLRTDTASMRFTAQGTTFTRELFTSAPDMGSGGRMEAQDRTVDRRFQVMADFDAPARNWKKGNWYDAVPPLTAPLASPAARISHLGAKTTGSEVWVRPLKDGARAVGFTNRGDSAADVTLNWADAKLTDEWTARDLWQHKDLGAFDTKIVSHVPSHGTVLLKLTK